MSDPLKDLRTGSTTEAFLKAFGRHQPGTPEHGAILDMTNLPEEITRALQMDSQRLSGYLSDVLKARDTYLERAQRAEALAERLRNGDD